MVFGWHRSNEKANTFQALRDFKQSKCIVSTSPCEMIFDLTNACRIRCLHCYRTYSNHVPTFIPEDIFARIPARFYENVRQIDLSGMGEPTLHPQWNSILERVADDGRRYVTFNTSLTFLKDDQIRRIAELGCGVSVSIDAAKKVTFERIRSGASYEQVFGSLRKLLQFGREFNHPRFSCHVKWVLYKDNLAELREFIAMASDMGIRLVSVQPLAPHHDELKALCCESQDPITQESLLQAYEAGTAKGVRLFVHEHLTASKPLQKAIRRNNRVPLKLTALRWHHRPDLRGCSFPWTQMKIDSDCNIVSCCFSDKIIGNARTDDIETVWNNQHFRQLRVEVNGDRPALHCIDSPSGGVCCPRIQFLKRSANQTHFLQ